MQVGKVQPRLGSWRGDECALGVRLNQADVKAGIFSDDLWQQAGDASRCKIVQHLDTHRAVAYAACIGNGHIQPQRPHQDIKTSTGGEQCAPGNAVAATFWQAVNVEQDVHENAADQNQATWLSAW